MKRFALLSGGALLLPLLASLPASACGPYFPPSYLTSDNPYSLCLRPLYVLELLGKHFWPEEAEFQVKDTELSTDEGTRSDFITAVGEGEALARYLAFDARCRKDMEGSIPALPTDLKPAEREFYLYSRGYAELRLSPPADLLPADWKTLLGLPAGQRHFRTSWVLYMLGNTRNKEPDAAQQYYRQLREAVRDGFADSLNLVRASYRLQRRSVKYLPLAAWKVGVEEYDARLRVKTAIRENPAGMFTGEVTREVLLAYLPVSQLAEYLEKIPSGQPVVVAERLASECYEHGEYLLCQTLLEKFVPPDSLIRLYLEAKFARRNHETTLAAEKMKRWLAVYQQKRKEEQEKLEHAVQLGDPAGAGWAETGLYLDVQGMLGAVKVVERDFVEALHCFLAAGSWNDAAAVAEQMLSVDALLKYCVDHQLRREGEGLSGPLLSLLGRRLMREYRASEAGSYLPPEVQQSYSLYCQLAEAANRIGSPLEERAAAMFNLGQLIWRNGWELFATELDPDYMIHDGNFDYDRATDWSGASPYTRRGESWWYPVFWRKPANLPKNRFHYRYLAAQTFARAAVISADSSLRAAALFAAGDCLKSRDPFAANEYYKMLCDLRPQILGEAAAEAQWFPQNFPRLNAVMDRRQEFRLLKPEDFSALVQPDQ